MVPLDHVGQHRQRAEQRIALGRVPLGHQRGPISGPAAAGATVPAWAAASSWRAQADARASACAPRTALRSNDSSGRTTARPVAVVRVDVLLAAEHDQRGVAVQVGRQRLAGVRPDHLERRARLGEPLPQPTRTSSVGSFSTTRQRVIALMRPGYRSRPRPLRP